MALTASAQTTYSPSWDEAIVPSLRNRLLSESQMISKRMSAVSISDDESGAYHYAVSSNSSHTKERSTTPSLSRPSAIPRPSYQARTDTPRASTNGKPHSFIRTRTNSQPRPYDPNGELAMDPGMRAASPANAKPTRIPVAARSWGPSIQPNGGASAPMNGHAKPFPHDDYDRVRSQPPSAGATGYDQVFLPDEKAPFPPSLRGSSRSHSPMPNGNASHLRIRDDGPVGRRSGESEERPFEHWYRGDTERNGGVGELRVARREQMLEIANYGHSFRNSVMPRRRADSLGARRSFYLEDTSQSRVLDEGPLTDVEVSEDTGMEDNGGVESAGEDDTFGYSNHLRTKSPLGGVPPTANGSAPEVQLAADSSSSLSHLQARLPPRGASEPTSFPSSPHPSKLASSSRSGIPQRAHLQAPHVPNGIANSRGRVKSNAAASTTSSVTSARKGKPASTKAVKKSSADDSRRSVGTYPVPKQSIDGDEDLADAIPTWTQPKTRGPWDEVVLPVVARKQGLDEQYEQADGNPRPRQTELVYEPAPGTFGYDHSKYKPPRPMSAERMPNNDYGRRSSVVEEEEEPQTPNAYKPSPRPQHGDQFTQLPVQQASPSPAPFAEYMRSNPMVAATPLPKPMSRFEHEHEQQKAGCCGGKCVVM